MKIPNDLEQYSQRLIDFCDSLSASAYVNFHRLFLMRVVKSNPNKMMLDMYVVRLQSLLVGSRKNVAGVRKITTYKPFDMPSDEELDMINLLNRILNKK